MRVQVAVGVIVDAEQRILITQRDWNQSHGGYWEFPGGKIHADETPAAALAREMQEELGIQVLDSEYLGDVVHDYDTISVQLVVFRVKQFSGMPIRCESQLDLRWVPQHELKQYQFPEANLSIVELIVTTQARHPERSEGSQAD